MSTVLAFVRLTRPLFLAGGFAGVALGAAVAAHAGRRIDVATYLWAQALVTAFHLMVHYANDYFDRASDAGARRTAWSGGSGVLAGALAPAVALRAALVCAVTGVAITVRFALAGSWTVAALGGAILCLAWCYSAPPVRLAARGLGELDTVAVVAVLVPSVGYAAFTGRLDDAIATAVLAPAGAVFAMMLAVELPDADADTHAAKRTLAVRWGPARTWQMIAAAAGFTLLTAVGGALRLHGGPPLLALAPAAASALALVRRTRGDPRPASIAFWGVALAITTVAGLAAVYALAPPDR